MADLFLETGRVAIDLLTQHRHHRFLDPSLILYLAILRK